MSTQSASLLVVHFRDIDAAEREKRRMVMRVAELRQRFASAARERRQDKGISLRQMAKACHVSASMLCDFELGRRWSAQLAQQLLVELNA